MFASILTSVSHIAANAGSCTCLALVSFMSLCKSDMLPWFSFSRFASGEEPSVLGLLQSSLFRLVPFLSSLPGILFKIKEFSSRLTPRVTELRKT